ncbi:glutamine--fructose-6-phosphate transaminase (isomerizing) [Candidatus Uhrbacteria bacterium]|nr:glutamine--fructose-6-phosphate transaminase (isomerizing) [Candidatus Uhrbacteria bacterium]
MCGIVGYIGNKQALPILLQGLRRLEYRGYDSAGVALVEGNQLRRERSVGRIEELAAKLKGTESASTLGIAHTRWATHGGVTEENAHPHFDCKEVIAVAHNGIIENYKEIRSTLVPKHTLRSQTDSEILTHLIEEHYHGNLRKAVAAALAHVRGTYGLAVVHRDQPDLIIVARMGSPLVIGMGDAEYYIASDPSPMLAHTKRVTFLDDGEIAEVTRSGVHTVTLMDEDVNKCISEIEWDDATAQKQGYEHFMLKEIFDQPAVLKDAIRGRIDLEEGTAHLGGINLTDDQMRSIDRIVLIACGTASYAAMIGKYAFERLVDIPVEVDVASEFRYRDPVINERTLVFAISQSGETLDTLAAIREARRKGAIVRGIVNVVGSTIARETEGGTYIHAGPELAVASTKAFTNMVAVLLLYAVQFGRLKRVTPTTGRRILTEMLEIPKKISIALEQNDAIRQIAQQYSNYSNYLFLGRGMNYPVAMEGALKLKEISYIHSEAYPGGEMKHGPIALLSSTFPVVAIHTKNALYDKMESNIEEVRARGAKVIAIATQGDDRVHEIADEVIWVPATEAILEPLVNTIPLQLFAYHMAIQLGRDVDRPRNLAKSVTVE